MTWTNKTTQTATLLLCLSSLPLSAQTSAHRSTTSSAAHKSAIATPAKSAVNPADNPPGVPPVTTPPKTLYALRYVDIKLGTGAIAPPDKFYTVKYTGWLTNGTKFDSSYDHPGQDPITFYYGGHRVIPGWDTGFTGMRVGGKRRLYIPWQLAYGEQGRDPIPPKSDLIFDIELVGYGDSPTPAPVVTPPPTGGSTSANPGSSSAPDAPTPQGSSSPR